MQPEYYYNEILRWNFGFENPNKAAVLFACLLPLLWMAWMLCWRIKPRSIKVSALLMASILILGNSFCLFMTFSRGGVVAAGLGLVYLFFYTGRSRRLWATLRARCVPVIVGAGLLLAILVLFVCSGLGGRSVEITTDASVGNRLVIWSYALQMAVENPFGFGSGNSGKAYMQWYQPVERTEGYRTLVNSYLTFLIERGWVAFLALLFGFLVFWLWTAPPAGASISGDAAAGMRACLLAFLTAGFFSTVMEEGILWVLPGGCILFLIALSVRSRTRIDRYNTAWGSFACFGLIGLLYAGGLVRSRTDPIYRKFESVFGGATMAEVGLKSLPTSEMPWLIVPDAAVLGQNEGKRIRELVVKLQMAIHISSDSQVGRKWQGVILAGEAVATTEATSEKTFILLAPAVVPQDKVDEFLSSGAKTLIVLSDFDEDGRVAHWEERLNLLKPPEVRVVRIEGVGTQVDWAWDRVLDRIKEWK